MKLLLIDNSRVVHFVRRIIHKTSKCREVPAILIALKSVKFNRSVEKVDIGRFTMFIEDHS